MKDKNTLNGTIIKGLGGLYSVLINDEQKSDFPDKIITCRARGIFRHESITPLPGDSVVLLLDAENGTASDYIIDDIIDRKNSLIRPAVANLTHLFAVIPSAKPKPDIITADKLISVAEGKGIEPVIIITKSDIDADSCSAIAEIYRTGGFSVFTVSSDTGDGIDALSEFIDARSNNMIAAFAGASGAGKSTLMSRLFPQLSLKTGEISKKIERGKHTTRHAELYPFQTENGICLIADTPGFSMLDFTRFNFFDPDELPYTFREFLPYLGNCRYTKCTHTKEEGCAVLDGVKNGNIAKSRHDSYIEILGEIKKKPDWKRRQEERV